MPIEIFMPALLPMMEDRNLSKWLKNEGDKVSSGDVIAEIKTDKAKMEIEPLDEGIVAKFLVAAGTEGVKVNALVAILAGEREDISDAAKGGYAAHDQGRGRQARSVRCDRRPVVLAATSVAAAEAAKPPAAGTKGSAAATAKAVLLHRLSRAASPRTLNVDILAAASSGPHVSIVKVEVEAVISGGGVKLA